VFGARVVKIVNIQLFSAHTEFQFSILIGLFSK